MKTRVLSAAIASLITVTAAPALAGDADIFVFLENNPLQGVDITIDGKPVGETNARGEISRLIDSSGTHTIVFSRDNEALASTEFQLDSEQDIEVSVVLSTEKEPKITLFKTGDDDQKAMGVLRGQVKSNDGQAIAGAYVSVAESEQSFVTDSDGNFTFNLPRGNYSLLITHPDYEKSSLENLRVVANVGTAAVLTLSEKSSASANQRPTIDIAAPVEEVVILGYFNSNENSAFTLEQMSTSVIDVLDIEQIIRFGDANVASALKRVVGVSIVDGKYAVVRGLDGRYISATLNKNLMPTTNAFKRDAELDLFPADILGGIDIQKSFSADLPAESTAGTILVKTKDMPEDRTNKLSVSLGYNSSVTGEDFLSYEGGNSDFWGVDDGTRELPGEIDNILAQENGFRVCQIEGQANCISIDDAAFAATRLRNNWAPKTQTASPDWGLAYTLGDVKDFDAGSLGVYGSIAIDKVHSSKVDAFLASPFEEEGDYAEDTINTSLNGYLVAGFEFNDGSHIDSKTMLLRNTDDKTRAASGIDNREDNTYRKVDLEWKEQQFFGQQFSGHHFTVGEQELDWRLGMSQTTTDIPDRRTYRYIGPFLSITTIERLWGELSEDGVDLGVDYKIPFTISRDWRTDFKTGVLYNQRDRENEFVRVGVRFGQRGGNGNIALDEEMETLFNPQNFFDDAFRLNSTTTDTDLYLAEQESAAFYFNTETHYNELVTVVAGARQENFSQDIGLPNTNDPVPVLDESDLYPSLGVIYRPNDSWQLRTSASRTVSRPTITERAPARFYDENGDLRIGNPDLEPSDIVNLDLRLDYYFSDEGNVSLAFFHKDISDPVEVGVADGSGSATSALTWRNEEEATLRGVELDISTEFLNSGDHSAFIGGNITVIDSEVVLTDVSKRLQVDSVRDLQGQSPLLANIQLGYDHLATGQKLTFLLNYFDDRIDQVRRAPQEVIYEKGRMTLDFNYEIPVLDEQASIKVKIKNLTDAPVEYSQGDRTIKGWEDGTKLSLSFSYNF